MRLKRFKERDHKRMGIVIFTLLCIFLVSGVILYRTFAIFEVKTNQNVIKGKVGDTGDLEFAFYVDDKIVKESPKEIEKEKYIFDEESSSCTNDAKVYWDYENWEVRVKNISTTKTKCYLKFKTEYSEALLNGAVPKLEGDLTPVKIDENGTVRKADIKEEWYRYGSQQWANAVITKNSYELLGSNVHGNPTKGEDYIHLDGQDDYIDLGFANYNFSEGITLVLNAKLYNRSGDAWFGNWQSGGGGISISKKGEIQMHVYINDGYKSALIPNNEFDFDSYHVIVGTYDNEKLQLIIDGEVKATLDIQGTIKSSRVGFILGGNPSPENQLPDGMGQMDVKQAVMFNRAIDENEVSEISNNFKITNGSGLLKYVDFTNKEYEPNEVISEDNIESYFVWIPRYKYQIWNGEEETSKFTNVVENLGVITDTTKEPKLNQQQPIRIEFESKSMPISTSTEKGEYLTHPAFTSFDSNGFWVGKFETGYKGATSTGEAEHNDQDVDKVIIKPNVYSWRNLNVLNSFNNSKAYKENLDSHLMKNSEWGAIAYLTNSKYGRCPNGKCEEVRINNSQSYVTGSSAVNAPTCGFTASNMTCNKYTNSTPGVDNDDILNYKNTKSVQSSTTENYSGIYDMVGGSWENVMAFLKNEDGSSIFEQLGFTSMPEKKYYDSYDYSNSSQDYTRGMFGDGTKELGPFYNGTYGISARYLGSWYADNSIFLSNALPRLLRGGAPTDGTDTGIFAFWGRDSQPYGAFRIVLTP